jgi:hypothetical protein
MSEQVGGKPWDSTWREWGQKIISINGYLKNLFTSSPRKDRNVLPKKLMIVVVRREKGPGHKRKERQERNGDSTHDKGEEGECLKSWW